MRRLKSGQKVIIIYDKNIGFVQEDATFIKYETIQLSQNIEHDVPLFNYKDSQIKGLDCFWALPHEIKSDEHLKRIQYELIDVQINAIELSKLYNLNVPIKIRDTMIEQEAKNRINKTQSIIQKLGFDPRDESWIERDLAESDRERNWFAFERKNPMAFTRQWSDMVHIYNQQYNDQISPEEGMKLSKKRMRFLLGAMHTRFTGNANKEDWKTAAKEFEKTYRDIENRMNAWSISKNGKFPLVKTTQPVSFHHGPYFNECIEKIPHFFTDMSLTKLKTGTILRVVSYDMVSNHLSLDFEQNIVESIKGVHIGNKPCWIKYEADYDIWVRPQEVATHLLLIDKL